MSEAGLIPAVFKRRGSRFDTPYCALATGTTTILIMVSFEFDTILNVTNILNCVSLLMLLCVAIKLRLSRKDTVRPLHLPGGLIGLAVLVGLPGSCICFMIYAVIATQSVLVTGMSLGLVFLGPLVRGGYLLLCRKGRARCA